MADPIGIDFGGSGIKAAPVDLSTGEFSAERERIDTPEESSPKAVAKVMAKLLERFEDSSSAVGVTIPGVVRKGGVVASAANIDKSWIGTDADDLLSDQLGREVHVINDADAAGLAEARYGVARGRQGLIIVTTLGTGIGSALLYDGVLVPNTELGHLEIEGHDAETRAANSARKNEDLSWEKWAKRLTTYYRTAGEALLPRPDRRRRRGQQARPRVHPAHRDRHRDHLRDPAQHRRHRRRRSAGGRQAGRLTVLGLTPRCAPPRG